MLKNNAGPFFILIPSHPIESKYHQKIEKVNWESCEKVLDSAERRKFLWRGW